MHQCLAKPTFLPLQSLSIHIEYVHQNNSFFIGACTVSEELLSFYAMTVF